MSVGGMQRAKNSVNPFVSDQVMICRCECAVTTMSQHRTRVREERRYHLANAWHRSESQNRMRLEVVIDNGVDKYELVHPLWRVNGDPCGDGAAVRTRDQRRGPN